MSTGSPGILAEAAQSGLDLAVAAANLVAIHVSGRQTDERHQYGHSKIENLSALVETLLLWSFSVVVLGLVGAMVSKRMSGLSWIQQTDAVAAIGVAIIVIYISHDLGKKSTQTLLYTAPVGLTEQIKSVMVSIPGVLDSHRIRVHSSGPKNSSTRISWLTLP